MGQIAEGLHFDAALTNGQEWFAALDPHRTVAARSGEEGAKVAADAGLDVERLLERIPTHAGERRQQSVRGECAPVPVAALVLVERIAGTSIVARADDPYDVEETT